MTYKRVLIIRFGGLGDILLATPSIRALALALPGVEIDVVVGGGMGATLSGNPYVRNVWVFDKRGPDSRIDRFIPFLLHLARQRYDLVVNLHPSVKSFLMTLASWPRRRLVFKKNLGMDPLTGKQVHAVDDFMRVLAPLYLNLDASRQLDLAIPVSAHDSLQDLLERKGVALSARLVVINPAASQPVNRWDLGRFGEVAAHFADIPGIKVVVTGASRSFKTETDGQNEQAMAATVASAHSAIVDLSGQLSVLELAALLARCDTFLTCDTGPMHIASAVNAPIVALFGAADPDRTGPTDPESIVLQSLGLECSPCRSRVCGRGDRKCMTDLTVAAVIEAIESKITARRYGGHGVTLPIAAR